MTTSSPAVVIAALLIGIVIGSLVAMLLASRIVARERIRAGALEGLNEALRRDNDAIRQQGGDARSLDDLLRPVRDGLDSLRRATDAARLERTQADAILATQISAVQERYQSLEAATTQLASALARGQTRGQWGEMQLEGLLAHAGMLEGVHFRRQDTRGGRPDAAGERVVRPDVVIVLPGGGEVLVDAKFPFDAYWAAAGADDPVQRDALLAKHAADVLARARELSAKGYSDGHASPDFVVMFLPLESLLSAALESDGLLLERTFERRVVLATPTTMLALLRTIGFGYQRQLMADNAEEIKRAAAEMLARLSTLVEHLATVRKGLDQAVRGYNGFVGSFDSQAMRQARRLSELGVTSPRSLEAPESLDAPLRTSDPAALR
ncbi:MAG: DNA recombination protein RmuC [Actinomycetota bacterium]|nr:DNA recombination protein RmuC [Actinomycetota bacterium]